MARLPDTKEWIIIATTAATIGQQIGWIQPLEKKSEANRESNYSARDRLQACEAERYKWEARYLELIER